MSHCVYIAPRPLPEIRLGLNDELIIGREERRRGYGGVVLDDCNFHESTQLDNFEKDRTLSIMAPNGEVRVVRVVRVVRLCFIFTTGEMMCMCVHVTA